VPRETVRGMRAHEYDLDPRFARLVPGRGMVETSPVVCPAGHQIGGGRMTVGGFTCQCSQEASDTGYRIWTCNECLAVLIHPACPQRPAFTPWEGAIS